MLLIALTLIIIAMGVAAPKLAQAIKRDREIEMIHRGTQYARAVKKYYKKFGRYPTTIEQLENTNNIRFLRKRYTDPMAKDGKWRPVKFGDMQLAQQGSGPGLIGGGGGALPPVVGGALSQSGSGLSPSQSGSGLSQGTGVQTTTNPQSQQSNFGPSSTFSSGTSFGTQSSSFSQSSSFGTRSSQSGPASGQPSGLGQPGQTFGGGAILGVASTSKAKGFHEYNQKADYDKWLFIYDPTQDRGGLITGPYNPKAFVGQAAPVGTPAGQPTQQPGSTFGNRSGFGNNPGSFSNNPTPSQPSGGQPNNP